jgi:anti-sigma B factor antagonist
MSSAANVLIQRIGDATVVTLQESRLLESQQLDALGRELYRLVDEMDRKKLVVDCTKVQFMASAAIGVFVNLQKKSAAIKGTLIICGLRKELMQVFEITKLTKLFKFAADEKAALQALG